MINWDKVQELREDIGEEDFSEIVDVFLEEVETELEALPGTPRTELGASMHFLKGSALNLGFHDFSEKCRIGEILATQTRADEINISELRACYATSKAHFLQNYNISKSK
ncbi:Hpt domain-containing protein [Lentibacter sp. XHP0401]|uniref:Hpt domain-containing protein n=1 Tax=Lentibacter sp. XHP0401 TaxID=2984334 RepID=UPI0021E7481A|nr:Hpt domain-containing protein [Lentibacter sp. XHP0401]MCV2892525.1 Hpt domain-containing protein [Lentibacter sp. XHP0401]